MQSILVIISGTLGSMAVLLESRGHNSQPVFNLSLPIKPATFFHGAPVWMAMLGLAVRTRLEAWVDGGEEDQGRGVNSPQTEQGSRNRIKLPCSPQNQAWENCLLLPLRQIQST